jgi:hypothetical protein
MGRARVAMAAVAVLLAASPAGGADRAVIGAAHQEVGRVLDDLAREMGGLGERWREHFAGSERWPERPLITIMLRYRQELGLSAQQVEALERLRADFQKEVVRHDADIRVAELDLATLLRGAGPVDLALAEAKVREIERLRADLRIARLRAIEQGKALLTPEQRETLARLVADRPPASRSSD